MSADMWLRCPRERMHSENERRPCIGKTPHLVTDRKTVILDARGLTNNGKRGRKK